MRYKLIKCKVMLFTSVLLVASATASSAGHKHHARHVQHPWAGPAPIQAPMMNEPAHMVEVRPGVIISSYGCITDEGYGRWLPCGAGKR